MTYFSEKNEENVGLTVTQCCEGDAIEVQELHEQDKLQVLASARQYALSCNNWKDGAPKKIPNMLFLFDVTGASDSGEMQQFILAAQSRAEREKWLDVLLPAEVEQPTLAHKRPHSHSPTRVTRSATVTFSPEADSEQDELPRQTQGSVARAQLRHSTSMLPERKEERILPATLHRTKSGLPEIAGRKRRALARSRSTPFEKEERDRRSEKEEAMNCANCGNTYMDDSMYCRKCGTKRVASKVRENARSAFFKLRQPKLASQALRIFLAGMGD